MYRRTTKRSYAIPNIQFAPTNELNALISTKNEVVQVIEGYVKNRVPKQTTLENLKALKLKVELKIITLS